MITSFNHTGVVVRDVDAMVRFYTEEIGLTEKVRFESDATESADHTGIPGAKRVVVFLGFDDGHQLELVHYFDPPASDGHLEKHQMGASHVCFTVDDLRVVHADLEAKGIEFVTEPVFNATEDGGEFGIVYCRDPEGNHLEFIQL